MKITVENLTQDKSKEVDFPCSEEQIKETCEYLGLKNDGSGQVIMKYVPNSNLYKLDGLECKLDEINFFMKQFENTACSQNEFECIARTHKLDNMKDMINLISNHIYFVECRHETYNGQTIPLLKNQEYTNLVEIRDDEKGLSEFLYMPCEDYVIEKSLARLGCTDKEKLDVYLLDTKFKDRTLDILCENVSIEYLKQVSKYSTDFRRADFDIIESLVDDGDIETTDELLEFLDDYSDPEFRADYHKDDDFNYSM